MEEQSVNIQIALTTTATIITSQMGNEKESELTKADIPILVARQGLQFIPLMENAPIEQIEFRIIKKCKEIAKTVFIDLEKRIIKVGTEPFELKNTLVEYTHDFSKQSEMVDNFFKRWDEKGILIFEYQLIDLKEQVYCCLKGMWTIEDGWYRETEISNKPMANIIFID